MSACCGLLSLTEAVCCGVQVDLTDIGFAYPTRSDIVALQDVTFKLEPGKLVALVGLSGSGKSTLVALLQRLYDPNSGQVWQSSLNLSALLALNKILLRTQASSSSSC